MPKHHTGYDDLPESILRRFRWYTGPVDDQGCTIWLGPKHRRGYGLLFRRAESGHQRGYFAHRIAWILANGPVPDDLDVLHTCDRPICISPGHLFLGTNLDNIADKVAKGRQHKGETCSLTKLTEVEVLEIRRLHATGKYIHKEIGERFNTTFTNVWMIVNRKSWKHI